MQPAKRSLVFSGLTTVAFLAALFSRGAWQVFDFGCPTFALNLIQQIADGRFPPAFPECLILQLTIILELLFAAALAKMLDVSTATSLLTLLLFVSGVLFFLVGP